MNKIILLSIAVGSYMFAGIHGEAAISKNQSDVEKYLLETEDLLPDNSRRVDGGLFRVWCYLRVHAQRFWLNLFPLDALHRICVRFLPVFEKDPKCNSRITLRNTPVFLF